MGGEAIRRPAQPIDWPKVDLWSGEIARNEVCAIREAFRVRGARGPDITWNPIVEDLATPQLRFLMRYWADLAGERAQPLASEIDALEMRPALGYISLLDVCDKGSDFRYRLFGSIIASVSGFDMTGHLVSTMKASSYIVEFALAVFRATFERGEPLATEHGPAESAHTYAWHRLALPLADSSGATTRLLVGTVPMARDGRPISLRL